MLRTLWSAISHRWVLLVVGLAFVEGAAVLGVLTLLAPALQAQGVGAGPAGLATAAYGLGVIVTSRMVRFLSSRLTMPRLMALGGSTTVIGYALVAVHVSIPTIFIAAALLGATWSFLHSSLQTWSTSVLPRARGTVDGALRLDGCGHAHPRDRHSVQPPRLRATDPLRSERPCHDVHRHVEC
ncbi:hypothetical protein [Brevibacterium linens]|uniref:hypothetical protein n=1 Tax=Brevibacterium linens TaxID=1703 RepID=UPI00202A08A9|nr:hypothetical protein [Brevibacterium linens]